MFCYWDQKQQFAFRQVAVLKALGISGCVTPQVKVIGDQFWKISCEDIKVYVLCQAVGV